MNLKKALSIAFLCLAINSCASQFSYPELYDSGISPLDREIVTAASKVEILSRLQDGRQAWAEKQPNHYKYVIIDVTYFMCGTSCGPNEVEVKDGEIVEVTFRGKRQSGYSNGDALPEKYWKGLSIEAHFLRAEVFLNSVEDLVGDDWGDEQFSFLIDYDADLGYPKLIARNDPRDYHGDYTTRIGYFKVIE